MRRPPKAIGVISIGDRPWAKLTFPTVWSYAKSVGAMPFLINTVPTKCDFPFEPMPDKPGRSNKIVYSLKSYYAGVLLQDFEKVMILDDTCIVTSDAPDLFKMHMPGHVAAVREPILRGEDVRKREEDAVFDIIDKFISKNNMLPLCKKRECYVNSGVMMYDNQSKGLLSSKNIIKAQPLLFSRFPHQTLTYYLLVKEDIPIQIIPDIFNCANIFDEDRRFANWKLSPLRKSYIYHVTGWWKRRFTLIGILVDRLKRERRLL